MSMVPQRKVVLVPVRVHNLVSEMTCGAKSVECDHPPVALSDEFVVAIGFDNFVMVIVVTVVVVSMVIVAVTTETSEGGRGESHPLQG